MWQQKFLKESQNIPQSQLGKLVAIDLPINKEQHAVSGNNDEKII